MATIAGLDVNLGVRTKQFTRELNKAKRDLRSFSRGAQASFAKLGAATAGAAAGFAALARQSLLAADEVAKSARNAGLSADSYQRLAESFRLGGSSAQALVKGNQALLRNIRDLGRGLATQSDAFRVLGLTYRDLEDLSPEGQFLLVRERLSGVTNETQRLAIAQQLFGRAGKEFGSILTENSASLLEQGNRLQRLGGVMREDLLNVAEEINDQIDTTSTVIQSQFTTAILESIQAAGGYDQIDNIIQGVGQAVHGATTAILDFFMTIYEHRGTILNLLGAWVALRAVMFASAAIAAIGTLVGALGTVVVAIRNITLASLAARAAQIAMAALWIGLGTLIAAFGVAIYSAADAIKMGLGASVDFLMVKFRQLKLSAENVVLRMKGFFIGLGATIQEFLTDRINTFLGLINSVLSYLGREEIELISSDAADRAKQSLMDIRREIEANTAAQMALQTQADAAAAAVAGSASAAVSAGISGIVGVVEGARNALSGESLGVGTTETTYGGPTPMVEDQVEEDTRSIWQKIADAWRMSGEEGGLTLGQDLSANLSTNLSEAIGMANFESVGDIFLSTIQSTIQERVTDKLSDLFSSFFDSFFDLLSANLGGGGGGLGGLFGGIFHDGGVVPGRSGQEVPILAEAGEVVLTREQQAALLSGQAGGQTINQTIQVTGDVTEATRRAVRAMSGDIANQTRAHFTEQGVIGS